MKVGDRPVGAEHPCLIVAEVGLAHEGSYGQAHAFIDAVADAGADVVKFQCHNGREDRPWRERPEWGDETRLEYWQRTSFTAAQWADLATHAFARRMEFLCSPFSVEAVELVAPYVGAWKIPSGEVTNYDMLGACGQTGDAGIISMGLGSPDEIADAAEFFTEYALLVSTPLYPTPADAVGLDRLEALGERPGPAAVGLSDHSGTIYPGLGAVTLGCDILEVHVTMSREAFGPDTAASLDMMQLSQLVEGVRFLEAATQPMEREARDEVERMREIYMGAKA